MNGASEIPGVLVSADMAFRRTVRDVAARHGIAVKVEVEAEPGAVTEAHLKEIRLCRPKLVFLDLGADPATTGCGLAQKMAEAHPTARIVAAADDRSPDLLVSAMRSGVSEFLQKPLSRDEVEQALRRLWRRLGGEAEQPRPEGRVFVVLGAKGGVGSTTAATNLAIQLHVEAGKSTVLCDLDMELGQVATFLGLQPKYSVVDLASSLDRLDDDLLATLLERHASGIDVLAAPHRPLAGAGPAPERIGGTMRLLRRRYDCVVADVSSSLTRQAVAAIEEADEVLLVAQTDVPSLRNVQRLREFFRTMSGGGPAVRLVINRYQPVSAISVEEIEAAVGLDVYWTLSNDYSVVIEAINTGRPLVLGSPSTSSREIGGLVAKLTGRPWEPVRKASVLKRILRRLRPSRLAPRGASVPPIAALGVEGVDPPDGPSVAMGGEGR